MKTIRPISRGVYYSPLDSGAKLVFGFKADYEYEADSVVRGLELEAKFAGAPDKSSLILRGGNLQTGIHTVDRNLVLIATQFLELYPCQLFLVYDAVDRSLHMIPIWPRTYPAPVHVNLVLVARRHDDDRSYALVYRGKELVSLSEDGVAQRRDVLFVSPSSSASPWQTTKKANFPDHLRWDKGQFVGEVVLSSRGCGYWADLLCGVMYCDCADILSDDTDSVDIGYFDLPLGCTKYLGSRDDIAYTRAFRAMGCVGDSIKFVSIDGYLERLDLVDFKVRVWRLMEDMNWAVEHELKLGSLCDESEFRGNGGVPVGMAPMYPLLSMQQEDHVIYFALGEYVQGVYNCFPTEPRCLIRVDMHTKTFICTDPPRSGSRSMDGLFALSCTAEDDLLGLSC